MSRIIDQEFLERLEEAGEVFLLPNSVLANVLAGAAYDNTWKQVYDSEVITDTTTGDVTFFDSAEGKTVGIDMQPLLKGNFPQRQSFIARNFSVAFPTGFNLGADLQVLDGMYLDVNVQNGEAENRKLSGRPFMFPAGGGVQGVTASGDFTGAIDQQQLNNGEPTPQALFGLDVPIVIDQEIAFDVTANIINALTGITTGKMMVVMHGDFFERIS